MSPVTWSVATHDALYGNNGFYVRATSAPAAHFRTSVHASPLFAQAIRALANRYQLETVIDVGSGRGELLLQLHDLDPALHLLGVDVAPRPEHLPTHVGWARDIPASSNALLVANEWLDNVPVDVVALTTKGPRTVLVDAETGRETIGGPPNAQDLAWLNQWWPLCTPGERAEVGRPRDQAWGDAIGALTSGLAIAVDYGHVRASRPAQGSLSGYRSGRAVLPVPDGSCDITSSVALDACAAAGERAGATTTVLTTQRQALRALGVSAPMPSHELSWTQPTRYVEMMARTGELSELSARGGLGDFGWLIQAVALDVPIELGLEQGEL